MACSPSARVTSLFTNTTASEARIMVIVTGLAMA
jgi:hypothetical protein